MRSRNLYEYIPIPSNFWKKHIGEHYERGLHPLEEAKIIQSTGYFKQKGQCKRYRINPGLCSDEFEYIQVPVDKQSKDNSTECKTTRKFMRSLKLDYRGALRTLNDYIASDSYLEDVEVDPIMGPNEVIQLIQPYSRKTNKVHVSYSLAKS